MTLRARIALTAAIAVAVAVVATSVAAYVTTARTLVGRTDRQLSQLADDLLRRPARAGGVRPGPRAAPLGGAGGFVQLIDRDGAIAGGAPTVALPVTDPAARLAREGPQGGRLIETADADGVAVRVLTVALRRGALQVALPVEDLVTALTDLRRRFALGSIAGVGLAAVVGLTVARRAVRPVTALTEVAEEVARTGDLGRRIGVDDHADDEIGRLARTFDDMLANLEQAREAQRQLVADASHELRTPLTSLRTNIEVLAHQDRLGAEDRRALIRDVVGQLEEFGRLVDGLVELARGAQPVRGATPVRLDEVVRTAVGRVRTFAPHRRIEVTAAPTTVLGEVDRLDRAVANLLDNAVKYGSDPVEVDVQDGAVRVRDHGRGIDPDHLPHVFDRFYRAPEARAAPGSGLGLSIVRQVAESHGGAVTVANADGGGAVFTLRIPAASGATQAGSTTRSRPSETS